MITSTRRGLIALAIILIVHTGLAYYLAYDPTEHWLSVLFTGWFWNGVIVSTPLFWATIGVFGPWRIVYQLPLASLAALWMANCYTFGRYASYGKPHGDQVMIITWMVEAFIVFQVVGWPTRIFLGLTTVAEGSEYVLADHGNVRWSLKQLFVLTAGAAVACLILRMLFTSRAAASLGVSGGNLDEVVQTVIASVTTIGCMGACLAITRRARFLGVALASVAMSFVMLDRYDPVEIIMHGYAQAGLVVSASLAYVLLSLAGLRLIRGNPWPKAARV